MLGAKLLLGAAYLFPTTQTLNNHRETILISDHHELNLDIDNIRNDRKYKNS